VSDHRLRQLYLKIRLQAACNTPAAMLANKIQSYPSCITPLTTCPRTTTKPIVLPRPYLNLAIWYGRFLTIFKTPILERPYL
jgi:hypothetical protein